MSTSSLTKAARHSPSQAFTRGKQNSGATGHRKRGVWGDALVLRFAGNGRTPDMTKPELGTKRLCAHCGAKFYDLHHSPITCPKCGRVFEPMEERSQFRTAPEP